MLHYSTAEKYVSAVNQYGNQIMDALNTYVAAGIAVQCYGGDNPFGGDYNSGYGLAQITNKQASTEYGVRIPDPKYPNDSTKHSGFGLLCWIRTIAGTQDCTVLCKTPEEMKNEFGEFYRYNYELRLEPVNDQNDPKWAVEFMRRRIKLVMDVCDRHRNKMLCDATDKFIIAALAQNGSGFTIWNLEKDILGGFVNNNTRKIEWEAYFDNRQLRSDNTRTQNRTTGNRDYDTKYMLDLFYKYAIALNKDGYWLPTLDEVRIKTLYR